MVRREFLKYSLAAITVLAGHATITPTGDLTRGEIVKHVMYVDGHPFFLKEKMVHREIEHANGWHCSKEDEVLLRSSGLVEV